MYAVWIPRKRLRVWTLDFNQNLGIRSYEIYFGSMNYLRLNDSKEYDGRHEKLLGNDKILDQIESGEEWAY